MLQCFEKEIIIIIYSVFLSLETTMKLFPKLLKDKLDVQVKYPTFPLKVAKF